MLTYHYPMVYIGNVDLKSSLRFSNRISYKIYDPRGSLANSYHNSSLYDLIIQQDIVNGEPQVDLAICETVTVQAPRFTLSHGTCSTKSGNLYDIKVDNPELTPFLPGVAAPSSNLFLVPADPLLPGVPAPRGYDVPAEVPAVIFDNLDYCELLILVTGAYLVIKKGWNMPDDASKKKIASLYEAMALLTGY
jgi:hypothetical protein